MKGVSHNYMTSWKIYTQRCCDTRMCAHTHKHVLSTNNLFVLQPIAAANSPTLTATINKLSSSLDNWKTQAERYRSLLQHSYSLDKAGKFKPRIDAVATTYHQRIAQLQSTISDIKEYVSTTGKDGFTIAHWLNGVCSQFDNLDPNVDKLEMAIGKVGEIADYTAKIDGIFQPLQWMLQHYNCTGDVKGIKAQSLGRFQDITKIASKLNNHTKPFYLFNVYIGSTVVRKFFENLSNEVINHYFPVQSVIVIVGDTKQILTDASAAIAQIQNGYLVMLQSIEKIQIGNYQFTYYNPMTKKTKAINNYFFSDAEVVEATQLGKDMQPPSKHS